MDKYTAHAIFRTYLAIGRAESFTDSEIGAAIDFVLKNTGELIGSFPTAQQNFYSSEEVETAIEKFWGRDFEQSFIGGVMANPGTLANTIICNRLKKRFDVSGANQFDKTGELEFPRHCDFFVAKKTGNFIEKFLFYKIEKDGIKQI